jgi:4-hydroxy-2-oxoheptanedioate aldolase
MRTNRVKQRLRDGKIALSGFVHLADPTLVEILGMAGFDGVFIDMEHTTFDLTLVKEMIRASDVVGVTSIVRIPEGDWAVVLRLLDAGAQGIWVPHVDGVETAKLAIDAVRYPPLGRRGAIGFSRATNFGAVSWDEHVRSSNDEVLLVLSIEDEAGLEQIELIAALDGVDLVNIGPHDLATSMGITDLDDPRLREAVEGGANLVRKVGKAGMDLTIGHPMLPLTIADLKRLGCASTSVNPPPEVEILAILQERVAGLRREIEG